MQQQKKLYGEWAKVSAQQESILSEIALRREPADLVFPPIRQIDDVQKSMPQRQLVLSFFNTSRGMAVFMFNEDKLAGWLVEEPDKVVAAIKLLLKEMGHFDGNQPLSAEQLKSDAWKKPAGELLGMLTKNCAARFLGQLR